jgi:phosphoglycerate dehydrogenase-like enzyme
MKSVVILDDYQNCALKMGPWDRLAGKAELRVITRYIGERDELIRELADAQVIVCNRERTPITKDLLSALPKLELVVTSGMRNNSIDVAAAASRGITVSGTATLGYPTAELTIGMILGWFRNIPQEVNNLHAGRWQQTVGVGVRGKTLGVVGFGRIGGDVAKVCLALGMKVLAWSRSMTPEKAAAAGVTMASLDEVMSQSDVVSVHLLANAQTRGIIGAREIGLMKNSALLVNTARAALVDQDAMIDALNNRRIGGAALDVYDVEPLPSDHPLLKAPNTLLTPHLGYVMEENYRVSYTECVEDIEAWLAGKPIRVLAP